MPKAVQINTSDRVTMALMDDGSIWRWFRGEWLPMLPIPVDEYDERLERMKVELSRTRY